MLESIGSEQMKTDEGRPLIQEVRQIIEGALRSDDISLEESARLLERYEKGLVEYTYRSGRA